MERYVCIHAHFYQPPRENPWLEEIELQDSQGPLQAPASVGPDDQRLFLGPVVRPARRPECPR